MDLQIAFRFKGFKQITLNLKANQNLTPIFPRSHRLVLEFCVKLGLRLSRFLVA